MGFRKQKFSGHHIPHSYEKHLLNSHKKNVNSQEKPLLLSVQYDGKGLCRFHITRINPALSLVFLPNNPSFSARTHHPPSRSFSVAPFVLCRSLWKNPLSFQRVRDWTLIVLGRAEMWSKHGHMVRLDSFPWIDDPEIWYGYRIQVTEPTIAHMEFH